MKEERYSKLLKKLSNKINSLYSNQKLNMNKYIRLGLLAKYAKSIKAICLLDVKGFYEDANIILRTVFETFITIMYCELDLDNNYKRFYDYNIITRLDYIKFDNDIKELWKFAFKDKYENMKSKEQKYLKEYKPKNKFNWTDKSVLQLCKELDKNKNDTFYESMYYIVYKNYSDYIHPNIVNIFGKYITIRNNKIKLNVKANVEEYFNEIIEIIEQINSKLLEI